MPEGKALKVLPPELPKEYREFVACTRDTLEVPPGPLTWARIPGVPDSLKPTATFEHGENGAVKVTISAAGLSLQVDISVSKHGNLKADTSSWPTDTPFIGDQLKDLAKGVSSWVDDLNADFRKNNKKIGGLSTVNGRLTGSKVALDAKVAMVEAPGGDQFASARQAEPPPLDPAAESRWWAQQEPGYVKPEAVRRTFPRPAAVGVGLGIVITVVSTAGLLLAGTPPGGAGTFVLPPIGAPVAITGSLATTDLDFEIVRDISSGLNLTVPRNGGLVRGSAQVKYEARGSSGATFTNTSDLDVMAVLDLHDKQVYGIARHHATGEAPGQPAQTREISPLIIGLKVDPATGKLSGAFQGKGFSYPVTGSADGALTSTELGNMSLGAFDPTPLSRTDATEKILENYFRLFANEGNQISGVGLLRVNQAFDTDAFGAGCTFEAIRAATVTGIFDLETGTVNGTAQVVAWGNKSDPCTFDTGVAAEEAPVTGTVDRSTGKAHLSIDASKNVLGSFAVNAVFDESLFSAPGQQVASDKTVPVTGLAIGLALTLGSLGLGLFLGKPEPALPPPPA